MLPNNQYLKNAFRMALFFITMFALLPAYAQQVSISSLSAEDMLVNIAQQIPNLMKLVTAIAYVLGMYFIFHAVIKFKHFGESRTMMSQEQSMVPPIVYLTVGAMLLYLPTAVQVGLSTFWTLPNPYGYLQASDQWGEFINVCYLIIQFVGVVAFIRGLVILSHVGSSHGQPYFAKGLTHIIGGIFCINIFGTVQMILNTLGIQAS